MVEEVRISSLTPSSPQTVCLPSEATANHPFVIQTVDAMHGQLRQFQTVDLYTARGPGEGEGGRLGRRTGAVTRRAPPSRVSAVRPLQDLLGERSLWSQSIMRWSSAWFRTLASSLADRNSSVGSAKPLRAAPAFGRRLLHERRWKGTMPVIPSGWKLSSNRTWRPRVALFG